MLAFGLVAFTVFGGAEISRWVCAGFDLRLGFVLGAVTATTDAIAATSIAKRIGLPQRIVDILEAESLVNDATGLLALDFALAMVVEGRTPTVGEGLLRIAYLTVAGLALGLLVGLIAEWLEHRIDDGPIEIVLSVLVPYAAYLAAETIHASGVLAVVACGMYMSQRGAHFSRRTYAYKSWQFGIPLLVLNGLVFMLMDSVAIRLAGIREYSLSQLLRYGALFSGGHPASPNRCFLAPGSPT